MNKIIRELSRFYSKVTDRFLLTENFYKYQVKYSKIYSNNYNLEKNQFSFVHAPKTAGTTINNFLIKNNVNVYRNAHNLISKKCNPVEYRYITSIRNPIQRTKSFYEMQLNNRKLPFHYHSKKGLKLFLSKLKINQNCMCKFIIGDINIDINDNMYPKVEENLKNFWFIIDFDNIENDVKKLSEKLNIRFELEHKGKKYKKKDEYSEKDNELIKKHNKYDLKLFNFFKNNLK